VSSSITATVIDRVGATRREWNSSAVVEPFRGFGARDTETSDGRPFQIIHSEFVSA